MNRIVRYLVVLLALTASVVSACASAAGAVESRNFEFIDTGLEQSTSGGFGPNVGVWLDESRVIVNALQAVPNAKREMLQRAVIFDLRFRQITPLLASGIIVCWNSEREIAGWRLLVKDQGGNFVSGESHTARLTAAGQFSPIESRSAQGKTRSPCRSEDTLALKPDRLLSYLNEEHGYIDRGKRGGGYSYANAILYRPGKPSRELPVPGGSINTAEYLPFLDRYLLNHTDYLSGRIQPSGRAVFYLMRPDGEVEELPQPRMFTNVFKWFDRGFVMQPGVVVKRMVFPRNTEGHGFFLLKGDQIIRAWGESNEGAMYETQSPDGCKLAFLSGRDAAFNTRNTVKILNICKEE